jgi:hypothetical protein
MRRGVVTLAVLGAGLGVGATALAQGGGNDDLLIDMDRGCLEGTRVTVRIVPPDDAILSPVHIRAGGREAVHLTGVTGEASVTVRLPAGGGRVSVSGESTGGERFSAGRDYRRCSPAPPRNDGPTGPITGGGEG